jgi:hypothetical protein
LVIQNQVFPNSPKMVNEIKAAFEKQDIMDNFGKTKHEVPFVFF